MNISNVTKDVLSELEKTLSEISSDDVELFVKKIVKADKIFLAGLGRSGFMARAFAMRLMHLGLKAYFVGETTTPNIGKEDLLIVCSGSGETGSLAAMARKCGDIGADLALVSIFPESTIGKLSSVTVRIPAPTPKVKEDTGFTSIQPMGSLFEQSLLLFLDSVILILMEELQITSDDMFKNHANLE